MNGWLCQDCRSVNASSANNCYRCWTPRKFAEAPDPATLPPGVTVEQAHAERNQAMRPSPSDARSSRRRSRFVLAFITVTVAFSALNFAFVGAKGGSLGIVMGLLSGEWTTLGSLLSISLVGGLLSLLAAIAWFVWFDRVLKNVPPLTGKWPEVSRPMAVIWWLVPVVGQLKGTFVVGHVYELMAVASSPGLWLLGLWGVTWVGGTMAPGVAGFVVGWLPLPLEESVHLQDLISNLGQISYIAAGFFAAALILAFEHAQDVRMAGKVEEQAMSADFSLEARLGVGLPASITTSWIDPAPGAAAWPGAPNGLSGWPSPGGAPEGGPPGWPSGPPPIPGQPASLTDVRPTQADDTFEAPAAKRPAKDRGPIPFEPILLMGALVLAGAVAGITMAGMGDPFGELGRLTGQGAAVRTPRPVPTAVIARPGASAAAGASALPSPVAAGITTVPADPTPSATERVMSRTTPTPAAPAGTPAPADVVARRLLRIVTDERYRGVADMDATYTDASGDTTWKVRLGRVGEREYRLQQIRRPGTDTRVLERAALVSTTWERTDTTDWVQRRKTEADRATSPLFDLAETGDLSFQDVTDEGGTRVYRFGWEAGEGRIREFARSLGAAEGLSVVSGELSVTEQGVPVRLELRLVGDAPGDAADPSLVMTVRYSDVGSDIQVRNPRVGPPLVVRS